MQILCIFRQTCRRITALRALFPLLCLPGVLPRSRRSRRLHSAPTSVSPTVSGSITGKVSEKHGGPMAGARVSVLEYKDRCRLQRGNRRERSIHG